jgi:hypothetical protein
MRECDTEDTAIVRVLRHTGVRLMGVMLHLEIPLADTDI